jgi:hypothetical protein
MLSTGLSRTPRLAEGPREIDLGSGAPGEVLRGRIDLRNIGTAPLTFSASASCGCTALAPTRGTVAPGAAAKIDVALKMYDAGNSQRRASVLINTNDPSARDVVYIVHGVAPTALIAEPSVIQFGEVGAHSIKDAFCRLTVYNNREGQQAIIDPHAVSIKSVNGTVSIDTPRILDGAVSAMVRLTQPATTGDVYDSLVVSFEGSSDRVTVPVHAVWVPKVRAVPSTLFFARSDAEHGPKAVHPIIWTTDGTSLGEFYHADAPGMKVIEEHSNEISEKRRHFVISREDDWTKSDKSRRIALWFTELDTPVVFNVRFLE